MTPIIVVSPATATVDQKIATKVYDLESYQQITICARFSSDKGDSFESFGHFTADQHGKIDLQKDPSSGGTYVGVDSMGLFWSMIPAPGQRKGTRLIIKNVEKPLEVKIVLFDSHVTDSLKIKGARILAEITVKRTYLAENVEKIPISVGRLRGTLFIPTGKGSYPGVIDLFGYNGGLLEFRAALLARYGFVCLALAYFAYQDLPKDLGDVEVEYFLEAAEWLSEHDRVLPGGIGVIGTSFGGQLAFQMAAYSRNVIAAISVSGPCAVIQPVIRYKGRYLTPISSEIERVVRRPDHSVLLKDYYTVLPEIEPNESFIPVENGLAKLLAICGEDDLSLSAKSMFLQLKKRLSDLGLDSKLTILTYPGAGHLLEPPYMPLCTVSFVKMYREFTAWGGRPEEHNAAQCHSWRVILEFLKRHTGGTQSKL